MRKMGWWWGRSWRGPWPGHGPWSHLPPWQRPGWVLGWMWWRYGYAYPYTAPFTYPDKELELRYLEDLKKYLSDVILKDIDTRIEELKKELKKGTQ